MSAPDDQAYDLPDKATDPDGFKTRIQRFYGFWNRRIGSSDFAELSLFMNWGYLPGLSDEAVLAPRPDAINASSVRLILELVGPSAIAGADILDVGCGRGGTVDTLLGYYQPRHVTGLDLTPENIAFCQSAVRSERCRFLEGDAENLPFDDARFDIVTNVESSHCYPDIRRFYRQVARVLKPGGLFLYTDVFDTADVAQRMIDLADCGLDILSDRDITPNVLMAREAEGDPQLVEMDKAAGTGSPDDADERVLDLVVARPGSQMHVAMQAGRLSYRILRARKRMATGATGLGRIAARAQARRGT